MRRDIQWLIQHARIFRVTQMPNDHDMPEMCEQCYCYAECPGW